MFFTYNNDVNIMNCRIQISQATPNDVCSIHEVMYETFLRTYVNPKLGITKKHINEIIKPQLEDKDKKMRESFLRKRNKDSFLRVAKFGGVLVGVCSGHRNGDVATLKSLYVLPEYQGRGIGKKLWQSFQKWADVTSYNLKVASYNRHAIDFYKKLGFRETGKEFIDKKFTFSDGVIIPQIEMGLDFEESRR
jgi:ribosomal protein S18 acetylase RimI-like enzyme